MARSQRNQSRVEKYADKDSAALNNIHKERRKSWKWISIEGKQRRNDEKKSLGK